MNKQRVRQLCTVAAHGTKAAINSTLPKFRENSDSWNPIFLFYNNVLHVIFHSPVIWNLFLQNNAFLFLLEWLAVHNKQKINFFALKWTLLLSIKHCIRKLVTILILFSWKYSSNYLLFQIARDTWEGNKKETHKHNGVNHVYKKELSRGVNHIIPTNLHDFFCFHLQQGFPWERKEIFSTLPSWHRANCMRSYFLHPSAKIHYVGISKDCHSML